MPVDYFRGEVIGIDADVLNHRLREQWSDEYFHFILKGDEVIKTLFRYKNLQLAFFPSGRVTIGGSLHKFHNDGIHNYDQFSQLNFNRSIELLEEVTTISSKMIRITAMEHGVNIKPLIPTNHILNYCFQHRGSDFEEVISNHDGKYQRARHNRYELKLYNKKLQYKLDYELLRLEVKTTNWCTYRKKGIVTLADFIECDKSPFIRDLLTKWNEVLFVDPTTTFPTKWHPYTNREFWRALRGSNRTAFHRHKWKARAFAKENGLNIQENISNLIIETIARLQNETYSNFM